MPKIVLVACAIIMATIAYGQEKAELTTPSENPTEAQELNVGNIQVQIEGLKSKIEFWNQKEMLTEEDALWLEEAEPKLMELEELLATKHEE